MRMQKESCCGRIGMGDALSSHGTSAEERRSAQGQSWRSGMRLYLICRLAIKGGHHYEQVDGHQGQHCA